MKGVKCGVGWMNRVKLVIAILVNVYIASKSACIYHIISDLSSKSKGNVGEVKKWSDNVETSHCYHKFVSDGIQCWVNHRNN